MKRLIQVYDKECIRNIGAILAMSFDEVLFLYDQYVDMTNRESLDQAIMSRKNIKIAYLEITDIDYDLKEYQTSDNYYNLNGARSLLNTYLTIFVTKNLLQAFYLFTNDQKLVSINGCEQLQTKLIHLPLQEIVSLSGSKIISNNHLKPDINDKILIKDIENICRIMKKDFSHWARFIQKLAVFINKSNTNYLSIKKKYRYLLDDYIISDLIFYKILIPRQNRLYFKSPKYKEMLKSSGNWLEYDTYLALVKSKMFDEVDMSIVIDFDGDRLKTIDDRCEIDVVCTKGLKTIYISNKIGKVHQEALYEIKSHAMMFGKQNGIPIICTGSNMSEDNYGMYKKAQELGIYVIENQDIINNNVPKIINAIIYGRYRYKD